MTTYISLNDQAFWAPSVSHPVKPQRVRSSQAPTSWMPGAALPTLDQNTSSSNDAVVISSDEESDSNDVDDDDHETDSDDDLLLIAEIVLRLNRLEGSYVNTAGKQSQLVLTILMGVNVMSRSSSELCHSA